VALNSLDRGSQYVVGYVSEHHRWEVVGRIVGDLLVPLTPEDVAAAASSSNLERGSQL
jgi:hypothetical protein